MKQPKWEKNDPANEYQYTTIFRNQKSLNDIQNILITTLNQTIMELSFTPTLLAKSFCVRLVMNELTRHVQMGPHVHAIEYDIVFR